MSRIYYPEARVFVSAIVENFGASQKPITFPARPRSLNIHRNSYKQPDSWSIELDAKDFPIPPSLLRTGQVFVQLFDNNGLPPNPRLVLETVPPAIVGIVDSVTQNYSSSGRTVSLDGQDMTALFSETTFKNKRNLTNKRLDRALDELRREVDITNSLKLVTEIPFADSRLPIIGKSVSRTNRKGFPVKRGDNYWNVMYNLALKHGFILFVRDLELVLATPQSVIEESTKRRDRTFKLSWGKNVEQLSVSRNMGKERVPQIEVLSYDERTRRTIAGRFPKSKQKVTTGVGTKRNEVLTTILRGVTDKSILERLAEVQYNLIARTEQVVEFSTRELADEDNRNLIYLKAGDALFLSFDPFNTEELKKIPDQARTKWLVDRGFTPQAASVFANHFDRINTFKQPFYVREARIDWSHDDGLSIDATMANFVNIQGTQEEGEVAEAVENV